jgi:hypothetical protein
MKRYDVVLNDDLVSVDVDVVDNPVFGPYADEHPCLEIYSEDGRELAGKEFDSVLRQIEDREASNYAYDQYFLFESGFAYLEKSNFC